MKEHKAVWELSRDERRAEIASIDLDKAGAALAAARVAVADVATNNDDALRYFVQQRRTMRGDSEAAEHALGLQDILSALDAWRDASETFLRAAHASAVAHVAPKGGH